MAWFDGDMVYVLIVLAWFAIGAAVGVREARRGHWKWSWVPYSIVGPLAFPLARAQHERMGDPSPVVLAEGVPRRGRIDVLIGHDGSDSAMAAGLAAVSILGNRLHRVMLASVLDSDTASPHDSSPLYADPWPEEILARDTLELASADIERLTGHRVGSVILSGEPATALERYAIIEGYELIVVGCRGKGLTKRVLGSCAERLARQSPVPVLIVPDGPVTQTEIDLRAARSKQDEEQTDEPRTEAPRYADRSESV